MGKWIPEAVMDASLENIADNANILHACSADPVNYAGIAGVTLGNVALTPGDGNGDFTISNGDASGRKLTVTEQTVAGTGDGTANHIVLADTGNSLIKAVTTCANFTVQNGINFTVSQYDPWEINDPT